MEKKASEVKGPAELEEVLNKIHETKVEDVKLRFITRCLKSGVKKREKTLHKYSYKAYHIDVDDEIRQYLYDSTKKELDRILSKNYSLVDYDPISDDTDHLFSYKLEAVMSDFSDVVERQLKEELPKVTSLESLSTDEEELWAFCIGFLDTEDTEDPSWVFTFRKFLENRIAIDEKDDADKIKIWRQIRTVFSTSSKKLTLMKGEGVTLDKQIDCLYCDEKFYVLNKLPFEQIVGLHEEYHLKAIDVFNDMKSTGLIDGLDIIEKDFGTNTTLHKKLVKLRKNKGLNGFNKERIKKMVDVCVNYGETITTGKDGHIIVNDRNDFETVIKAMSDYYKKGEISGRSYGTFSGKELEVKPKPKNI